jgi:hypothetical protein
MQAGRMSNYECAKNLRCALRGAVAQSRAERWYARRMRRVAVCFLAHLSVVLAVAAQDPGSSIEVPAGSRLVMEAQGDGVQVYVCKQAGGSISWTLTGPEAQLLDPSGRPMGKHFAGPTWQLTDGSTVQGVLMASRPSSEAGAVAWLLLGAKPGTATGKMSEVAFIRRTQTHGGVADPAGCRTADDAGKTARVPYSAHYAFYAAK